MTQTEQELDAQLAQALGAASWSDRERDQQRRPDAHGTVTEHWLVQTWDSGEWSDWWQCGLSDEKDAETAEVATYRACAVAIKTLQPARVIKRTVTVTDEPYRLIEPTLSMLSVDLKPSDGEHSA